MHRSTLRHGFVILAALAVIAAPLKASADSCSSGKKDIVDTAVTAGSFNTLATALTRADLVDALKGPGPFTVFAPTDQAFDKLPDRTLKDLFKRNHATRLTDILTYHVVSGRVPAEQAVRLNNAKTLNGQRLDLVVKDGSLTVDGAKVVTTVECSNGVIHVIDRVLIPSDKDIVTTANDAGMFKTLIAAVQAADLKDALQGDGPFTVFAPTDDAFSKLPKGTIESLLKSENREQLASILKLHVVPGRAFATDALTTGNANTLQNESIRFRITDGQLRVNDASIVKTDIDASNGVIHVIDSVLLPEDKQIETHGPRGIIDLAIERGVPLFNDGDAAACTAIYEIAAQSLLQMDINPRVRTHLKQALGEIRSTHDAAAQAWILRGALDTAHASL